MRISTAMRVLTPFGQLFMCCPDFALFCLFSVQLVLGALTHQVLLLNVLLSVLLRIMPYIQCLPSLCVILGVLYILTRAKLAMGAGHQNWKDTALHTLCTWCTRFPHDDSALLLKNLVSLSQHEALG